MANFIRHSCIEAEQERDNKNMCTDMVPTERDLKDLRDRLQVRQSFDPIV